MVCARLPRVRSPLNARIPLIRIFRSAPPQPKAFIATALLLGNVDAHGRMERLRAGDTTVTTRGGAGFEDSPTGLNNKFICRNPAKKPAVTITAGGTMEVEWSFGAAHLGDCALYMSYSDNNYFKIANFPECNVRAPPSPPLFHPSRSLTPLADFRFDRSTTTSSSL